MGRSVVNGNHPDICATDGNSSSLGVIPPETAQSSLIDIPGQCFLVKDQSAANGGKRTFQFVMAQRFILFRKIKQKLDITVLSLVLVNRLTVASDIPAQYFAFNHGSAQAREIINNLFQLFGQYGGVGGLVSDGRGLHTDGNLRGGGSLAMQM